MGMTRNLAKLLLEEHRRKPFKGRGIILGRQTIFLTPDEAVALVTEVLGSVRPGVAPIKDTYTYRGNRDGYILDVSFFSLFTDAKIEVLDYSAYQGATIVQDLCAPLPYDLKDCFDFVINGSVFDNIFDPATAMDNVGEMLKENGVSFHVEGAHHFYYAYIKFGASWFFDYAVVNNYFDCKVFYCVYKELFHGNWEVYLWTPYHVVDGKLRIVDPLKHEFDACVVAILEKQAGSTIGKRPIQANYRQDHQQYVEFFNRTMVKGRNLSLRKVDKAPGHFYLGSY